MKVLRSAAYRLAEEDPDFLAHDDARGVRLELEYSRPSCSCAGRACAAPSS
jgi:hypothetical protein